MIYIKNPNQFVKDRDLLIYWGFIDCIEHGKTTRTKKHISVFGQMAEKSNRKKFKSRLKPTKSGRKKRRSDRIDLNSAVSFRYSVKLKLVSF